MFEEPPTKRSKKDALAASLAMPGIGDVLKTLQVIHALVETGKKTEDSKKKKEKKEKKEQKEKEKKEKAEKKKKKVAAAAVSLKEQQQNAKIIPLDRQETPPTQKQQQKQKQPKRKSEDVGQGGSAYDPMQPTIDEDESNDSTDFHPPLPPDEPPPLPPEDEPPPLPAEPPPPEMVPPPLPPSFLLAMPSTTYLTSQAAMTSLSMSSLYSSGTAGILGSGVVAGSGAPGAVSSTTTTPFSTMPPIPPLPPLPGLRLPPMDLMEPASDLRSLEALMEAQLKLKTLERPLEYPPEVTDVDPLSRYSRQNFAIFLEKIKFAMAQIFPKVRLDHLTLIKLSTQLVTLAFISVSHPYENFPLRLSK